jgi:predicted dehydrogenase
MKNILLVGAGGMAQSYFDVLQTTGFTFEVVCRSLSSADIFEQAKGYRPIVGGVSTLLKSGSIPEHAIVAVGVEHLSEVAEALIKAGVKSILVEKPGGLFHSNIQGLNVLAIKNKAKVYVAYNRRFYTSVSKLLAIADTDGGIRSLSFDFSEWADMIAPIKKGPNVKERWVLSNSTHVIDLAFFLAGKPKEINAYVSDGLDWHRSGSKFTGSGLTERGVLFSYRADWDAPGRWGLIAYTNNYKLELLPLEGLLVTERNSVVASPVELDDENDKLYKPGVFEQLRAFMSGDTSKLCPLAEQLQNYPLYAQIAGYET